MTRRHVLALACGSFMVLGLACVDLFHGTDFETLCSHSPSDPACGSDAGTTPDVVIETSTDGAIPRPDFCAWSESEAKAQAARACAWLGACEGSVGESTFGACSINARLAYDCGLTPALRPRGTLDAFWACLATVQSCGDVDRCVFPGGVQDCVAVPTGSTSACGTALNDSVRLECAGPSGRARGVEPCAMFGKTCSPEDTSAATCSGKLAFACTKNACSGTSLVDCRAAGVRMLDRGTDCAAVGAGKCVESDAGPYCAPGAGTTACAKESLPKCDGNYVVDTCIGGASVRVNCERLGLFCDVSQLTSIDPTAACVNRGAGSCTPGSDTCASATLLRSCGRGANFEVDCASVGLGNCSVNTAGHGACGKPAK
jgi:hypothetical protein